MNAPSSTDKSKHNEPPLDSLVCGLYWIFSGATSKYEQIVLSQKETLLGRSIYLMSQRTSTKHAQIRSIGNYGFEIEDLGSTHGTFLNGKRIRRRSKLPPNALIRIGDDLLVLIVAMQPPSGSESQLGDQVLCKSVVMRHIAKQVHAVAKTDKSVLLDGESGAGKEVIADAIHRLSGRAGDFVTVNCAELKGSLAEAKLFGYKKGAFTGANETRPGYFEVAEGGTLFLDEIGSMPSEDQAALLRVLQTKTYSRLGEPETVFRADVRVVAATNYPERVLPEIISRLGQYRISISPLRDRKDEILFAFSHKLRKPVRFEANAAEVVVQYDWPGNVRQLFNVIDTLEVDADPTKPYSARDLRRAIRKSEQFEKAARNKQSERLLIDDADIHAALAKHAGNNTKAAEELGISRRDLGRRIARTKSK